MSNEPKNTAMPTILAFHYQILLALQKCFAISSSQAVWIEKDGDISIISENKEDSEQIEVKDYENPLTDNHENFCKTLKNWLAPEFDHKQYAHLILHTTQIFGKNTKFSSWNNQDAETKLEILKSIYNKNIEKDNERKENELSETDIYQIQREIFENNEVFHFFLEWLYIWIIKLNSHLFSLFLSFCCCCIPSFYFKFICNFCSIYYCLRLLFS